MTEAEMEEVLYDEETSSVEEFEIYDLRDRIAELENKIEYAKSNLLEHMEEEAIAEIFGEKD
jgi:predicted nuclease with TOPRIM domain